MGVDFLTCSQCAETFPDCGPHQYCDRGHSLCPNCMGPAGDGAEVPADECPVCLAGGTLLEQSRKRAAEDHATIATLRAERDALAKRVFEKDQGWAECQRDRAAFEDLAKTLEKERDGWKYKYDGALAAIDRVVAQRDAAVARAERMQERAEQHRGDANGFAAENASLRAALTHIAEGNASPAIDYARAALSAAPAAPNNNQSSGVSVGCTGGSLPQALVEIQHPRPSQDPAATVHVPPPGDLGHMKAFAGDSGPSGKVTMTIYTAPSPAPHAEAVTIMREALERLADPNQNDFEDWKRKQEEESLENDWTTWMCDQARAALGAAGRKP